MNVSLRIHFSMILLPELKECFINEIATVNYIIQNGPFQNQAQQLGQSRKDRHSSTHPPLEIFHPQLSREHSHASSQRVKSSKKKVITRISP